MSSPLPSATACPSRPVFLTASQHIPCPLEAGCRAAWNAFPAALRAPLETVAKAAVCSFAICFVEPSAAKPQAASRTYGAALAVSQPARIAEPGRTKTVQEPHVVPVELADVVDAVAAHADPLDAQAEGEAGDLLGIVADGREHVRIDHAGAAHLDPAVVPLHVDLDARLGEREERRAGSGCARRSPR